MLSATSAPPSSQDGIAVQSRSGMASIVRRIAGNSLTLGDGQPVEIETRCSPSDRDATTRFRLISGDRRSWVLLTAVGQRQPPRERVQAALFVACISVASASPIRVLAKSINGAVGWRPRHRSGTCVRTAFEVPPV